MQILLEDIEVGVSRSRGRQHPALRAHHVAGRVRAPARGVHALPRVRRGPCLLGGRCGSDGVDQMVAPLWPFPQPGWSSRIDTAARMAVRVLGMRRIASALAGRLRRPQVHDRLTLEHVLELDTSTGLLETAARLSVPPSAVIVYALMRAVYRLTGSTDQHHLMVGHGRAPARPETDLSRTISLFRTTYPLALHIDPDAPVVDELQAVQRRLESVPRGGLAAALASVGSGLMPLQRA